MPPWTLQRDPRNFSRPDEFRPERWLAAESAAFEVHDTRAFAPFSTGPWNCVGKNLALLEMKVVVTHMLQRLHLRFDKGFEPGSWEPGMQDRFNLVLPELPVVVERRF